MNPLSKLRQTILRWNTTVLVVALAVIPLSLSFDYGGILSWSQCVAAIFVTGATGLCVIALAIQRLGSSGRRQRSNLDYLPIRVPYLFVAVWLLWCGFIAIQTLPLGEGILNVVSPGSCEAYRQWMEPVREFASIEPAPGYPISIHVDSTLHRLAFLLTLLPFALTVNESLSSRRSIILLMSVLSIGTAVHALYGMLGPESTWTNDRTGFGGFVNRNNAALFLNLGMAANLGFIAWRVGEIAPASSRSAGIVTYADSLIQDRFFGLAVGCLCVLIIGVITCGSRGGLIAMIAGFVFALLRTTRTRLLAIAAIAFVTPLVVSLALLIAPWIELTSLTRLKYLDVRHAVDAITQSTRLTHWRDGLLAAKGYFPAGSGAGTYSYAYLPYQQTGTDGWFHHADNQYLELLVEHGIVGCTIVTLLVVLFIRALVQLRRRDSSLDRGLSVAGWFMLAATAVSQFADFGLLLPANSLMAMTLFAVIVGRSISSTGVTEIKKQHDSKLKRAFDQTANLNSRLMILSVGLVAGIIAIPILRSDAEQEFLVARAKQVYHANRLDLSRLTEETEALLTQKDGNLSDELAVVIANCQFRIARLKEIESLGCQTSEEFEKAFDDTRAGYRRLGVPSEPIRDRYLRSIPFAVVSLEQNPLSIEARAILVYTQFAHGNAAAARDILKQLAVLQRRNGSQLMRLARMANFLNLPRLTEELTRQATSISDAYVPAAMELLLSMPKPDFQNAVGDLAISQRQAALRLLVASEKMPERADDFDKFLESAASKFSCDTCETRIEEAACERLAGLIAFRVGQPAEASEHFERAIKRNPTERMYRFEYIRELIGIQQLEWAKEETTEAIELFPNDQRFRTYLNTIERLTTSAGH